MRFLQFCITIFCVVSPAFSFKIYFDDQPNEIFSSTENPKYSLEFLKELWRDLELCNFYLMIIFFISDTLLIELILMQYHDHFFIVRSIYDASTALHSTSLKRQPSQASPSNFRKDSKNYEACINYTLFVR